MRTVTSILCGIVLASCSREMSLSPSLSGLPNNAPTMGAGPNISPAARLLGSDGGDREVPTASSGGALLDAVFAPNDVYVFPYKSNNVSRK